MAVTTAVEELGSSFLLEEAFLDFLKAPHREFQRIIIQD